MNPYAFHVPPANYRRRPRVRLAVATREPFPRIDFVHVFKCVVIASPLVFVLAVMVSA